MHSFRNEIENPIVEKDIIDLEKKINRYYNGEIDEERFRSLRLARGIYGQRQFGVQMIRIKLPYGKLTSEQLLRIAAVSDKYSRDRLHITTRQDIQIHHVSLDRTPELWAELEKDDVTLREACGNTVRNVTASETAGIDPNEPFDVSPYAHAMFEFFLRNPVCQEMGRKFKIAFSGTVDDTALAFMNDLGFIAKEQDGIKGFKVLLGGGLGAQPKLAYPLHEFIESFKIIPLTEAILRVFDRYGERIKRSRARLKFLLDEIGLERFKQLISEEQKALSAKNVTIVTTAFEKAIEVVDNPIPQVTIKDKAAYSLWKKTNVIPQKQKGYSAIGIKVHLGDFYTNNARKLAKLVKKYAGNEMRLTLRQNILIRHVKNELLPFFYIELKKMGFANPGYNSTVDITACPGTDTCNLGIANSTSLTAALEKVLMNEYPEFLNNKNLTIKISGCMNSCGQHAMAHIGFQGMSVKSGTYVAPALQVLLGGSTLGNGKGRFSDKVIKIPSRRAPNVLRALLNDFKLNHYEQEPFLTYYQRKGKIYFYNLLKPLVKVSNLNQIDFIDWGSDIPYERQVGIGECAGTIIDLVATLLFESEEKISNSKETFEIGQYSDSIYYSYSSMINAAKALLLTEGKKTNTHAGIINQFDEVFKNKLKLKTSFSELIYQIKNNKPSKAFAASYFDDAQGFYNKIKAFRSKTINNENT